jgi:hypothetical protein
MRSAWRAEVRAEFHPEWGYLAPAPSFVHRARVVLVATAVGATVGAGVVFSRVSDTATETSVAARTLVGPVGATSARGTTPAQVAQTNPPLRTEKKPFPVCRARAVGKMSRSCADFTRRRVWLGRESCRWFPPRRLTQSASPSNPPLVAEKSKKSRTRKVRAAALRLV